MKQYHKVKVKGPKSSNFNLSHEKKLTMDMGELVPVLLEETLPGDQFSIDLEAMVRFQPLLAPIMHRINVYCHFFFVPNRIIWNEWEDFITGGPNGDLEPNHPKYYGDVENAQLGEFGKIGSLPDYYGFPVHRVINMTGTDNQLFPVSQLPYRAYQQIWYDYYRDQNLISEIDFYRGSDDLLFNNMQSDKFFTKLQKRAWEKDYFTSALPWAQRGSEVKIPMSGEAELNKDLATIKNLANDNLLADQDLKSGMSGQLVSDDGSTQTNAYFDGLSATFNNLSSTIRDLRTSYAIQRWMERNARAGSRYIEQILSHFGVKSSDSRLQRPEFLGGGKMPVQISEVLQTSATEAGSPQGNLSGHGITAGKVTGFKRRFEEHGYVIGLMSIIPRSGYMDGIPRSHRRFDRFDYFWPEFAHIGEQEVDGSELYIMENNSPSVFGYQERYAEYRSKLDSVHGDFRTNLDFWHLTRKFGSTPNLNKNFIECNPDDRIYPSGDPEFKKLLVQTYCRFNARRPIPKFGTPLP